MAASMNERVIFWDAATGERRAGEVKSRNPQERYPSHQSFTFRAGRRVRCHDRRGLDPDLERGNGH